MKTCHLTPSLPFRAADYLVKVRPWEGSGMPLTTPYKGREIIDTVRRIRSDPVKAYAIAGGLVAIAVLIRWWLNPYVESTVPFITLYPAIILATLFGGV